MMSWMKGIVLVGAVLGASLMASTAEAGWDPFDHTILPSKTCSWGKMNMTFDVAFGNGADDLKWRGFGSTQVSNPFQPIYAATVAVIGYDKCYGTALKQQWSSTKSCSNLGNAVACTSATATGPYQTCSNGHAYNIYTSHYSKKTSTSAWCSDYGYRW